SLSCPRLSPRSVLEASVLFLGRVRRRRTLLERLIVGRRLGSRLLGRQAGVLRLRILPGVLDALCELRICVGGRLAPRVRWVLRRSRAGRQAGVLGLWVAGGLLDAPLEPAVSVAVRLVSPPVLLRGRLRCAPAIPGCCSLLLRACACARGRL